MQALTDLRQKAADCSAAFKQTHDPAEAAAADAYNEAAEEIERLAAEVEAMMDYDNQKLHEAEMRNLALSEEVEYQHKEIERLWKMVENLAREVAGPYGIVADQIKAAEEQVCRR